MRIGIMLRAYDRPGGIGIYSRNIVSHLLEQDKSNEYVLFHSNPAHIGLYADNPQVTETHVPTTHQLVWDQCRIPRAASRHGVDLIFNTKFSVPFRSKAKRVMVLHGASWYAHPELYPWWDIAYVKAAMPHYCRQADFLISNSDLTTRDFIERLQVPPDKIRTLLLAAGDNFVPVEDADRLDAVRQRYNLPEQFLLTVTSYDPRKNFATITDAFEKARSDCPDLRLVVIGKQCERYGPDVRLEERGLTPDVVFPGWVDQEDLPAIYSLARAFIFPSVYEEFGIPVVEAMACGCPIASSTTGAIPDLTAGAALLCHPFDSEALAANVVALVNDDTRHAECRARGLKRAEDFSWARNATETLKVFDEVMAE